MPGVPKPPPPPSLFAEPLFARVAAPEDVAEAAAVDVGSEFEVGAAADPLRTDVTTTVTGPELCPRDVGDCVTTDVISSVVGAADDAVLVMKMVLGELCGAVEVVSDSTSEDTEEAIDEEIEDSSAAAEVDVVSETWLEVLDWLVEVTAKVALLAKGRLIFGPALSAHDQDLQVEFDMPVTKQSPERPQYSEKK